MNLDFFSRSSFLTRVSTFSSRIFTLSVVAGLCMLLFAGCISDETDSDAPVKIDDFNYTQIVNNQLNLFDFADHLVDCGLKVDAVAPLREDSVKAIEAMAITVEGQDIGVYRFNINLEKQRQLLEKYNKDGFVYILAYRYPVFMAGSYLVIGAEKHPRKHEIVAALRSFQ